MTKKEEITLHSVFELKKYHFAQSDEVDLSNMDKWFDQSHPAHIYFILSRQRIFFDKDASIVKSNEVELGFQIQKQDKYFPEKIKIEFSDFTLDIGYQVESEYPYSFVQIKDKNGQVCIVGKAAYFANTYHEQIQNKNFLDYEILYIGESTAKKNTTPAISRTTEPHHALQAILTDCTRKHLDKEIFFLFLSFKHSLLLDFPENPTNRDAIIKSVQEYQFGGDIFKKIKQRTALLEWLLVYYFKPEHNIKLKNNPPTLNNSSFDLISKMNLKKCTICFDLQDVTKVYTASVTKSDKYFIERDF